MIENYVNLIKLLDNNFDGIMIIDKNLIIQYYHTFYTPALENVDLKTVIGKTPFDIFSNIKESNSTLYKAVKYGEISLNNIQTLTFSTGKKELILDNTIPIIADGEIIGAINTVKYISNSSQKNKFKDIFTNTDKNFFNLDDIIGKSDKILRLKESIKKVARTSSNVLIFGETGTGKEMVAQAIHSTSNRKDNIFISQNCAAIPENLLESIFFGTVKGSFTDAINKPGIFEIADGGTIFLDEINSMPLGLQAKLLKIIEEQKVTRLGDYKSKNIDVRIISAINEDPMIAIEQKQIRKDFFYRLASVQLKTPSLKEIKSDIPLLSKHFINKFNNKFNMNIESISENVLNIFSNYQWPGNIRELKNTIESCFNFTENNQIDIENLPQYLDYKTNLNYNLDKNLSLVENTQNFEKEFILKTAQKVKTLSELAEILKISKQLLNYKINKYGLKEKIIFKI